MTNESPHGCREAFEFWASHVNQNVALVLRRKPSGEYLMSGTSLAWDTWQESWTASRKALLTDQRVVEEMARAIAEEARLDFEDTREAEPMFAAKFVQYAQAALSALKRMAGITEVEG